MKKILIGVGIIAVLAVAFLLGAKYMIRPVVFGEMKTVKALNMNLSDLRMELTFEVENPNFFPVTVTDFGFDVWLNESYIGKVQPLHNITLDAGMEGTITIPVRAEYKGNIFEGFLMALETFNESETQYRAEGFVNVKALYMSKKIHIQKSGTAKMLQPGDTTQIQ